MTSRRRRPGETGADPQTRGEASQSESSKIELSMSEQALAERIGHSWQDAALLRRALMHRSAAQELGRSDNERLEFLGDAVLGLVAAQWLWRRFPDEREGVLARHKSYLVSRQSLATLARQLGVAAALRLGVGEDRSGGSEKPALLADTFEAILGALYLDGGIEPVGALVEPLLEEQLARQPELAYQDVKSRLQELLQARGAGLPEYRLVAASGPDHAKTYEVECRAMNRSGVGTGSNKKTAERRAALDLYEQLGGEESRGDQSGGDRGQR